MMAWLETLISARLALVLAHFLWQGCAVALAAVLAARLLARASAAARCAIFMAALVVMTACLPVTYALVSAPSAARRVGMEKSVENESPTASPLAAALEEGNSIFTPESRAAENAQHPPTKSIAAASLDKTSTPTGASAVANAKSNWPLPWLTSCAPYFAAAYYVGAALMLVRLMIGLRGGARLRRTSADADDALLTMVEQQSQRIGLGVGPRVALCQEISIPIVVGVLRPMILLPGAFVSGLSPEQLRALATHELAHIRRYDMLFNLLQRIIEAVLFFHPAVWFVSRRVRVERENAADDMVLAAGWERIEYADALVRMAEFSAALRDGRLADQVVVAATGRNPSELKLRVLRVLKGDNQPMFRPTRGGMTVLFALLVCTVFSPLLLNAWAQAPPAPSDGVPTPVPVPAAEGELPAAGEEAFGPPYPPIMNSSGWKIHGIIHPAHQQGINEVAFSPDGKIVASAGDDKKVNLWNVADGRLSVAIERPVNCTGIAFSPDGALLAIAGGDHGGGQAPGEVVLWDLAAGKERFVLQDHKRAKYATAVCFSPDGKWLASAGVNAKIRLWEVATGKLYRTLTGHKALVSDVAFSPDGEMLASASFDSTIKLWVVPMGAEVGALLGHKEEVRGVAFSPDGRRLVSVGDDKTARIWDTASQKQVGILEDAHNGIVLSVAFAPGGRHVVTGGSRGSMSLLIWELETQNWGEPNVFPQQSSYVNSLAFSPDGRMLAIAGGWNSFQIWKRQDDREAAR